MEFLMLATSFICDIMVIWIAFKIKTDLEMDIDKVRFDVDCLFRKEKERNGQNDK